MASATKKLAIGLPVYNGEAFVGQTIESLLAQTFGDFTLVISDNASTDGTEAICREFARRDSRVVYSRSETNLGAAPNFNRAWELSRSTNSQYFKWQAADDLLEPTYLERCIETLDATPDAVLAHAGTIVIDAEGKAVIARDADRHPEQYAYVNGRVRVAAPDLDTFEIFDPPRRTDHNDVVVRLQDILVRTRWCFEQFGVIRSEAIRNSTLHFGFYGSDKVLLVSLALQGRFIELPDRLFLRRHHPGQSSNRSHESVAIWMDATSGRKSFQPPPQVQCLRWYVRLIARSGMNVRTQTRCYCEVVRWVGWLASLIYHERNQRGMLFRLKAAVRQALGR